MKFVFILIFAVAFESMSLAQSPGFFVKNVQKNVPRLGKRNNFLMKQGGKMFPRGRRGNSASRADEEMKYSRVQPFNHVQPFDSKFVLDFLSDEIVIDDGDLKFVAWEDFDKMLATDVDLKKKLTSIARNNEVEDMKKLIYTHGVDEVYGAKSVDQKFVPYDGSNSYKYNDVESDVYYYQNNDDKRSGAKAAAFF